MEKRVHLQSFSFMQFLIQRCWLCGNKTLSKKPLCLKCEQKFHGKIHVKKHRLERKGILVEILSFLDYSDPDVRQIILTIKDCEKVAPVMYFVNQIFRSIIILEGKWGPVEAVIPIPSTSQRRHGQLIAQSLAELSKAVWVEALHVSAIEQQKTLNQKGRSKKRFEALIRPSQGDELLVVDDILVTGSSMIAAAEAMGLRRMSGLALAFQPKQLES